MPSAEPETVTRAKAGAEPWPEMSAPPNPEPLPDWDLALRDWKYLWELHYIGFGVLFFGVAVFSCICVVKIKHRARGMTLANYFLAVCLMLMTFSVSRTLYLFLDPYESHTVLDLPVLLSRIIFAIGYPCLTSALSLIHFAFLEVNKLRLISRRLQNVKFLVSVIASHFVIVLVVYLVITLAPKLARLLILCQTVLISWWFILAACFLYSGWKVNWESQITAKFFSSTVVKDRTASTLSSASLDPQSYSVTVEQAKTLSGDQNKPSKGAQKIARISGFVSLLALLNFGAELYSLFSLYKLYDFEGENVVDHWPWWGYQTVSRILDFFLCLVIAYVIFPSTQIEKTQKHSASYGVDSHTMRVNKNVAKTADGIDAVWCAKIERKQERNDSFAWLQPRLECRKTSKLRKEDFIQKKIRWLGVRAKNGTKQRLTVVHVTRNMTRKSENTRNTWVTPVVYPFAKLNGVQSYRRTLITANSTKWKRFAESRS